jgi:hypothetical protein
MEKKTSVSIDWRILAKLKARWPKNKNRSVSYVLEKFMEAMVVGVPGRKERIGRPFRRF